MFFTLLSASAGMWLLFTPALWPDDTGRAVLAVGAGLIAILGAVMGVAAPRARIGVVLAGLALLVANFALAGELGAIANFATSGLALLAGGLAPSPRVVAVAEAVAEVRAIPAPRTAVEPHDVETTAAAA